MKKGQGLGKFFDVCKIVVKNYDNPCLGMLVARVPSSTGGTKKVQKKLDGDKKPP